MSISGSQPATQARVVTSDVSRSPEDTAAFGENLGRMADSGWVIGLSGELGAGKTELVKGIARALGVTGRVHSPTFALVHEYRGGRLPLFHLDFFRLDTPAQISAAGLEGYLEPAGVSVIEWAERWTGWLPADYRLIRIEVTGPTDRRIVYDHPGA